MGYFKRLKLERQERAARGGVEPKSGVTLAKGGTLLFLPETTTPPKEEADTLTARGEREAP